MSLDKKKVIQHLIAFLEEELREESDGEKRAELESLLTMYRFLPSRDYEPTDPIIPTSLVSLKVGEATTYAFIVPRGGGFITVVEGKPLQVLTPNSPLGESLLGKKSGDQVHVEFRTKVREYLIVASS